MKILVDTSVWIDLLGNKDTLQTVIGRRLIARSERLLVGDLVLAEVLQGTRDDRDFTHAQRFLAAFDQMTIGGQVVATQAARNYRQLRGMGITIRKTIDTLIATRCILDGLPLLYSDRDFDPFVTHLGLRSAMDLDAGVT